MSSLIVRGSRLNFFEAQGKSFGWLCNQITRWLAISMMSTSSSLHNARRKYLHIQWKLIAIRKMKLEKQDFCFFVRFWCTLYPCCFIDITLLKTPLLQHAFDEAFVVYCSYIQSEQMCKSVRYCSALYFQKYVSTRARKWTRVETYFPTNNI